MRLSFQRGQPPGDDIRSKVEVGTVPGRNAGTQDDGLRRGVNDTDSFSDVARQWPKVNDIDQVDRHVSVELAD